MTEAEKERAAVVAWLRSLQDSIKDEVDDDESEIDPNILIPMGTAVRTCIEAIERGDHIKGNGDG